MVAVAAQGFADVQVAPTVQAVQAPFESHTLPWTHSVPGGFCPWSAQTGTPVAHEMAPESAQGPVGVQATPGVQEAQACAAEQ
jgi:hypothetical protein